MARQAEIETTVNGNVKGLQTFKREKQRLPPKLVHLMAETLEEIRRKSKLVWRSNMVGMNYDEYYEDAPADLYEDKYWRQYDPEMTTALNALLEWSFSLEGKELLLKMLLEGDQYGQYLAFNNSLPVMEVHTPTKGDAITCWGNCYGFIPIRFWLKTKLWESKPAEKENHLAECPQYKSLRFPIDLSEDTTKENQRKSVVAYQLE
uniref:Uncharacterized protein n=1 Tax=Romanomermis culicivorax TaxID=13658 RepID=A0A915IQZ4_ROMCU